MDEILSLNLVELDLEPHVRGALLDAQYIAGAAPPGQADVLTAIFASEGKFSSDAFLKVTELLQGPFQDHLEKDLASLKARSSVKTGQRQDTVQLDAVLSQSYRIAQQFIGTDSVWGRDLVTVVLLASDNPFSDFDPDFDINDIRGEWYRFVNTGVRADLRSWDEWWQAAGVIVPNSDQTSVGGENKAYLLTWNPDRFDPSKLREQFEEFRRTGKGRFGWSLGTRRHCAMGDTVFLLRQGNGPSGLIGAGTIVGEVDERDHWDSAEAAKGKKYHSVPVEWFVLSEDALISITELKEKFTHPSLWTAQGGGREIPNELAQQLRNTLTDRLKPKSAELRERVKTHSDNPAHVDQLGRRPFAEVLAARIEEARAEPAGKSGDDEGAFMVLLHGPWGSGKSSVLNFIRDNLQENRGEKSKWVVVDFNAWRHQRLAPPWWTVIKQVYSQSRDQLPRASSFVLRLQWAFWRIRADWVPVSVALVLAGVVLLAAFGAVEMLTGSDVPVSEVNGATEADVSSNDNRAKSLELLIKIATATIAGIASIATFSRSLAFGSETAAKTYLQMRNDPLKPIVGLFKRLIGSIPHPVAVFIDDLDRCDEKYVVELLEGIQTLFRSAPVTYIVAADRNWICTSFEQAYVTFGTSIGDPGRPIGHLFLDKLFQISAAIPRISLSAADRYWRALLEINRDNEPGKLDGELMAAEEKAKRAVTNLSFQEEFDSKIAELSENPIQQQAMRAAAALKITSDEARHATEHRLRVFSDLLERNPRAMKRLVNAYGMHQASNILEGRRVDLDALARWTILELRWPVLADALTANPKLIDPAKTGSTTTFNQLDENSIVLLLADDEVNRVFSAGAGGRGALTEDSIRQIVGESRPAT